MSAHIPSHITIPVLSFDDPIVNGIFRLERIRGRGLEGTTHPAVYAELKQVFQLLESLASARIEGNHTTIDDMVEDGFRSSNTMSEPLREIANAEDALG
jgi:Fic family protein